VGQANRLLLMLSVGLSFLPFGHAQSVTGQTARIPVLSSFAEPYNTFNHIQFNPPNTAAQFNFRTGVLTNGPGSPTGAFGLYTSSARCQAHGARCRDSLLPDGDDKRRGRDDEPEILAPLISDE